MTVQPYSDWPHPSGFVDSPHASLFKAKTVVGRDGNTRHALPVDEVVELVRRHRP
jgi:hypothetical protein